MSSGASSTTIDPAILVLFIRTGFVTFKYYGDVSRSAVGRLSFELYDSWCRRMCSRFIIFSRTVSSKSSDGAFWKLSNNIYGELPSGAFGKPLTSTYDTIFSVNANGRSSLEKLSPEVIVLSSNSFQQISLWSLERQGEWSATQPSSLPLTIVTNNRWQYFLAVTTAVTNI